MGCKSVWKRANRSEAPPVPEKNRGSDEKKLALHRHGEKITKKAHAGRGQETKWEIPV